MMRFGGSVLFVSLVVLGVVSSPAQAGQPVREWTFMFWENGRSNLDGAIRADVNEMESVGSTDRVNLIVQHAGMSDSVARRYRLVRDTDSGAITSPVLGEVANANMGDWRQLADFVMWAMQNFPAKRYFLSIGSHGAGVYSLRGQNSRVALNPVRSVSDDYKTKSEITANQLAFALSVATKRVGRRIDVFAMDACLMAMVEIAAEVWGAVDYFGASQKLEPGSGWNYQRFLGPIAQSPTLPAREVARRLVSTYADQYSGRRETFSMIDMSLLLSIADGAKIMGEQLRNLSPESRAKVIRLIDSDLVTFTFPEFVDWIDFIDELIKLQLPELPVSWLTALRALSARAVLAVQPATMHPRANGVSIWLPRANTRQAYASSYRRLRFARATLWAESIGQLYQGR